MVKTGGYHAKAHRFNPDPRPILDTIAGRHAGSEIYSPISWDVMNSNGRSTLTHLRLALLCGALGLTACVSPNLDDLAEAECVQRSDCAAGQACVTGTCTACGPEVCDGEDNDCDDLIDEDTNLSGDPQNCGGCGVACAYTCQDGLCVEPDAGPDFGPCDPEVCDGVDNDCDGEIDEDLLNACGTCGPAPTEVCDGVDNDCDGEIDEYVKNACGECGVLPDEICDGLDNNCDGETDEGFVGLGAVCDGGEGACRTEGTYVCNPQGDGIECSVEATNGGPELCGDGVDNNCNGEIDEGFETLETACELGVGICLAPGVFQCTEDRLDMVCNASPGEPELEICDGLDNDCNAEVDEGFGEVGTPCEAGTGLCWVTGVIRCTEDGAAAECDAQSPPPEEEICDLLDNDCDGVVDNGFDLNADPDHCGVCNRECALPNAINHCVNAVCEVLDCVEPFENADGRSENGCECRPDQADLPDPSFTDANCDGIDGTLDGSIFVSALHGNDEWDARAQRPAQSLARALELALSGRGDVILLDVGTYQVAQTLLVEAGVSIHGGYRYDPQAGENQPNWIRQHREINTSEIVGEPAAQPIFYTQGPLVLDNLMIVGQDANEGSAVVIEGSGCGLIELRDTTLSAGHGALGVPGADGVAIPDTATSGAGTVAQVGGGGGTNERCAEATFGGRGGDGNGADRPPTAGQAGGGLGGEGGEAASVDQGPGNGFDAASASDGTPGEPAVASGGIQNGRWVHLEGLPARAGAPGGGGGGGGGNEVNGDVILARGGSGGGAGGCGGLAGQNGGGGGASIGILAITDCEVMLVRSTIRAGRGGDGAMGGQPSEGGPGHRGGPIEGVQGAGGRGAGGGCGGDAAGGPGGPAFGVLRVEAPPVRQDEDSQITLGIAGEAGASSATCIGHEPIGPPGLPGLVRTIACCPAEQACGDLVCPEAPIDPEIEPEPAAG